MFMSSERKIDFFSAIILILSFIALVMLLIGPFGGLDVPGYSWNGFSCLYCFGYSGVVDYLMQVLILILLILPILTSINNLLPNPFIPEDSKLGFITTSMFGILSSTLIWVFAIIGLISFGVMAGIVIWTDWWMDIGFYGPIVAGIINMILYFLKYKNKI